MSVASYLMAGLGLISLIVWLVKRNSFWGALTGVLVLFFLATLGWLWWIVPIIGSVVFVVGILVALLLSSRVGRTILAFATVLALLAGAASALANTDWASLSPASADDRETGSIAFDPAVDLIPAEAKCETDSFVDHSVRTVEAGNAEKRQFSTAVSIPFKGADDAAVMSEMTAEICGNPTVGEMVMKEMLLWTSKDIPGADENKGWLEEIAQSISGNPLGINSFVEKTSDGELVVTAEYQKYAGWLNTVLLRSVAEGKQSLTSVRNWEISAAADPSKGLPSVQQAKEQENKPVWVRAFVTKMDTCLLRFGFNAEDRRMEIFSCEKPKEEKPAPSTPSNNPPSGCTTNCGTTPPPPESCPPGQVKNDNGVCVVPKSNNSDDYEYPAGKPPVTVTTPPESTPPPVQTEQPGGNGVVDTPTNKPGSETGVTAPDSTPAPTTPSTPPPNEGGDNEAGDPGGF